MSGNERDGGKRGRWRVDRFGYTERNVGGWTWIEMESGGGEDKGEGI